MYANDKKYWNISSTYGERKYLVGYIDSLPRSSDRPMYHLTLINGGIANNAKTYERGMRMWGDIPATELDTVEERLQPTLDLIREQFGEAPQIYGLDSEVHNGVKFIGLFFPGDLLRKITDHQKAVEGIDSPPTPNVYGRAARLAEKFDIAIPGVNARADFRLPAAESGDALSHQQRLLASQTNSGIKLGG